MGNRARGDRLRGTGDEQNMLEDRARLAMAYVGHELNIVVHDDVVAFRN